jgi:hypothetical protein
MPSPERASRAYLRTVLQFPKPHRGEMRHFSSAETKHWSADPINPGPALLRNLQGAQRSDRLPRYGHGLRCVRNVRKQFSHCASTFGGSVDIEACKKAIESGRLRYAETPSLAEICSLVCPAQCIRFEIKIDPPSFQGCQPKKSIDSVHYALCGRVCQKDRVLDIPSTQLQSSHSGPCQS